LNLLIINKFNRDHPKQPTPTPTKPHLKIPNEHTSTVISHHLTPAPVRIHSTSLFHAVYHSHQILNNTDRIHLPPFLLHTVSTFPFKTPTTIPTIPPPPSSHPFHHLRDDHSNQPTTHRQTTPSSSPSIPPSLHPVPASLPSNLPSILLRYIRTTRRPNEQESTIPIRHSSSPTPLRHRHIQSIHSTLPHHPPRRFESHRAACYRIASRARVSYRRRCNFCFVAFCDRVWHCGAPVRVRRGVACGGGDDASVIAHVEGEKSVGNWVIFCNLAL